MRQFVDRNSIVRVIWGNADTILLIFAGSAAEFALNRAVDWLFFTGQLPGDPIGRFFSTVRWAQNIVFADELTAQRALQQIHAIHAAVERRRGRHMPDWAKRDVLYMLIDYSERAYRALRRPLTTTEQHNLYALFRRIGEGLLVPDLPASYEEWTIDRRRHLERDLAYSWYTAQLYAQYRRQLGGWRYDLLRRIQALLAPEQVHQLLGLRPQPLLAHVLRGYGLLDLMRLGPLARSLVVPRRYIADVSRLDQCP